MLSTLGVPAGFKPSNGARALNLGDRQSFEILLSIR